MTWREFSIAPGERAAYEIARTVYSGKTAHQQVDIVETSAYGLALFLDGAPQAAVGDEWVYHEALVHPPMVAHPKPMSVLICGGGEGATLREVLRHPSVEHVVMVDIDGELVDLARRHLEPIHQNAFADPRARIVIADARDFLAAAGVGFDVIILDLTDPGDNPIGSELYGEPFYRLVATRLAAGGVVATQAYAFTPRSLDWLTRATASLAQVFAMVRAYRAEVPFFKDSWAFCAASNTRDPAALSDGMVDAILRSRGIDSLRYYDGIAHSSMFALPLYARRALSSGG